MDRDHFLEYETACHLEEQAIGYKQSKSFQLTKARQLNVFIVDINSQFKLHLENYGAHDLCLPNFLRRFTAGHVLARTLFHLLSILEQQRNYSSAIDHLNTLLDQSVYGIRYRCKWYDRLITNLEHLKNWETAAWICKKAIACDHTPSSFAYRFREKLQKFDRRLKSNRLDDLDLTRFEQTVPLYQQTIVGQTIRYRVNDRKNIFCLPNTQGDTVIVTVEQLVIHHFTASDNADEVFEKGVHSENDFYRTLFALLFWDQLYGSDSPVDSFRFVSQLIPLDLESGEFYDRRRSVLDDRLERLNRMELSEIRDECDRVWQQNQHFASIANFKMISLPDYLEIIDCLSVSCIVSICRTMALDYRYTRSGFPDLLVWSHRTKRVRAIEVKGPGDKLSPKQLLWIDRLNQFGLRAEVCHVQVNDIKRTA